VIFYVEDDAAIRDLVLYALRQAGFEAEGFAGGKAFLDALRETLPELALLDQMLPGMDGSQLLADMKARERTRSVPVIMLTAKGSEMDKVRALDLGADDYIVKPFGVLELLSRVRAVLRRSAKPQERQTLVAGPVTLDTARREVRVGDSPVMLTNLEFRLLQFLMENPGIVFSREQILSRVWDVEYAGDTRTVDMHVRTLRQKLGGACAMIQTQRGAGYRLAPGDMA
jgi:two-component system alkaline phosphatase synthesis response regulator PhoP